MSDFGNADATVVAISVDPPERAKEIADAYDLEFPVLSDRDGRVVAAYGVTHPEGNPIDGSPIARPATFLIDRQGRIVWRDLTDNWRVRPRPEELLEQLSHIP